jgi:hypothetical protein
MTEEDNFNSSEPQLHKETFHLEMDVYDTGEYYKSFVHFLK